MPTRIATTKEKDACQEVKGRDKSKSPSHYPFISAKAKKLFTDTIHDKQPIKERALDLARKMK